MPPKTSLSSYALALNRVLLVWLGVRAVNLFLYYVSEHSSLHTEARLLVDNLCDTTHNRNIRGALIDCAQARTLVHTKGFFVTYALEHTIRALVMDSWHNATREIASLVQLLGMLTAVLFTSVLCLHSAYMGAQRLRYARSEYGESFMESLTGLARSQPPLLMRKPTRWTEEVVEDVSHEKFE
jgi:hypothetical protein